MLTRQQVPSDWVISIVDARGLRVARSRAHAETLGGRLSESAERVLAGSREGGGISYTLEGERVFTPHSRIASAGWVAVLGIPTALVDAAAWRSMAAHGAGLLLFIVVATVATVWIARGIARPMASLGKAANALARHQRPDPPDTPIREIREVGVALRVAADALARGDAEREALLAKETTAREAAEAADRAKEEFMAVLSHELRTPLNAVYGWARMLKGGLLRDPAVVARATDAIVRNADVQVQLIDDLLDLSRIASGKMRLDVRTVSLSTVLGDALDAVRPAAVAKQIALGADLDEHAGPVSGDPARLQQIVWNLLMNAVKFTPKGGSVHLGLRQADTHAEIVVRDTGQGIAREVLPHVFERFRQADSSSTRAHGGLGLGLALVKHLVELHGGRVSATSDGAGLGATFVVSLPVAAQSPFSAGAVAETASGELAARMEGSARLDRLRILVVDDDADALALAEAILREAGAVCHACLTASEGLEALTRLRARRARLGHRDAGRRRLLVDPPGPRLGRRARPDARDCAERVWPASGPAPHRVGRLHDARSKPVDPGELTAIIAGVAAQPGSRRDLRPAPAARVARGWDGPTREVPPYGSRRRRCHVLPAPRPRHRPLRPDDAHRDPSELTGGCAIGGDVAQVILAGELAGNSAVDGRELAADAGLNVRAPVSRASVCMSNTARSRLRRSGPNVVGIPRSATATT
ncbi:MAG: HAMP domain-containing sensor histidine kinase [Vicinamibacterales bacterium]